MFDEHIYYDNNYKIVPTADNAKILAPYTYMAERSLFGKMLFKLHSDTSRKLGVTDEKKAKTVIEIGYSVAICSIMLDDIQDRGALRKERPCAYRIYGIGTTCNCVSYVMFLTMQKVKELEHPEAMSIFLTYYQMMLAGQGMELYWRDNFICPTEEEYYNMVDKKTAIGLLLPAKLMQLFGSKDINVEELFLNYGRYGQTLDDLNDLTNSNFHRKKGYCRDITEGKHTIPIIYAIKKNPEKGAIIKDILMRRTDDRALVDECVSMIKETGALEYTKNKLEEITIQLEETALRTDTHSLLDKLYAGLNHYFDE